MEKLIKGIVGFKKNSLGKYRDKFSHFFEKQSPRTLFISCCDSRVVPNIFTSEDPGELFVLRNIGNIVPPYQTKDDSSVKATLEYAIFELDVKNIIVCGHSSCGAMAALLQKELPENYQGIKKWLKFIKPAKINIIDDTKLTPQDKLSQANVVQQLENLKTHPYINERIKSDSLKITGLWFEIKTADVYRYDAETKKFVLIEQNAS